MSAPATAVECRSCGTPIIFLRHSSTGIQAPIEAEPSDTGNCRIDLTESTYAVLGRRTAEEARTAGERLRLNHFAACPQSPRWHRL